MKQCGLVFKGEDGACKIAFRVDDRLVWYAISDDTGRYANLNLHEMKGVTFTKDEDIFWIQSYLLFVGDEPVYQKIKYGTFANYACELLYGLEDYIDEKAMRDEVIA